MILLALVLVPLALNGHRTTIPPLPPPLYPIPSPVSPTPAPTIDVAAGIPAGWTGADGASYQVGVMHDGNASNVDLRAHVSRAWERDWIRIDLTPVIGHDLVFAGVVPGNTEGRTDIVAMRVATGAVKRQHHIGDARSVGLALDGDRLFALALDGTLWAFDAVTGRVEWRTTMPQIPWYDGPPTAMAGRIYFSGNGTLYAVDERTGYRRQR